MEHMVFRARSDAPPKPSRAKWIPSAACLTLSLPRTDLLQRKNSDENLPSPLTSSRTLCWRPEIDPKTEERTPGGLEEIKMDLDNPNIFFTDFYERVWPRHSLGRPILGTPETVKGFIATGFYALRDWFLQIIWW